MSAAQTQMSGTNTSTSQTTQQGLMISQTNAMTMGGGQITQNVVPSSGQGGGNMGVLGQPVPAGAMQPRIRMPVSSEIYFLKPNCHVDFRACHKVVVS